MVAVVSLLGLVGLGTRKPEIKTIDYGDFRRFLEAPYNSISLRNGKSADIVRREFKGPIANSQNGVEGKYLYALATRAPNFKIVLTGIEDSKMLLTKMKLNDIEGAAEYDLQADDLPKDPSEIEGFHILVESGGRKAALVIRTKPGEGSKEPGLLRDIEAVIVEQCNEGLTGPEVLRWFIGDSKFSTAISKDFGGALVA